MPRLELQVRAEVETKVSPQLLTKIKKQIMVLAEKKAAIEKAETEFQEAKDKIETMALDAGASDELDEGFRVMTPLGEIPIKKIADGEIDKLDKKKLMKKFGLTPKDLKSCSKTEKRKGYLGVYFPRKKDDVEEED